MNATTNHLSVVSGNSALYYAHQAWDKIDVFWGTIILLVSLSIRSYNLELQGVLCCPYSNWNHRKFHHCADYLPCSHGYSCDSGLAPLIMCSLCDFLLDYLRIHSVHQGATPAC
jgi:hypothetical protein